MDMIINHIFEKFLTPIFSGKIWEIPGFFSILQEKNDQNIIKVKKTQGTLHSITFWKISYANFHV